MYIYVYDIIYEKVNLQQTLLTILGIILPVSPQNHLNPLKTASQSPQINSKPPQNNPKSIQDHLNQLKTISKPFKSMSTAANTTHNHLNIVTFGSCWLKLAQLGCKLAKMAPSWRLPDLKKQGQPLVFLALLRSGSLQEGTILANLHPS